MTAAQVVVGRSLAAPTHTPKSDVRLLPQPAFQPFSSTTTQGNQSYPTQLYYPTFRAVTLPQARKSCQLQDQPPSSGHVMAQNRVLTCGRVKMSGNEMTGKPIIRGTRLTVEYILNLLVHGVGETEILNEYAGLTHEDIRACLLFATSP